MIYFHKLIVLEFVLCAIISGQSVELPQVFMNKNEIKNIPIFIYNVNNLNAISIMIEYDESILLFNGINFNQNDLGNSYIYNFGYSPGEITLTAYITMGEQFNGSGKIGHLSFGSIGQLGEFSPLTFIDAQINSDWQISKVDGSIEIVLDKLTITAIDESATGSHHSITLGMCETCSDGWQFGEDEDDYPNPQTEYTNIHFYHIDWLGEIDKNGNICEEFQFSSDIRSQHSFRELLNWGIRGSIGGGLSSNIPINLSWDSDALNSASENFNMFIFIGDEDGVDMQQNSNIIISQNDLYLKENNEPNIWVKLGTCADIGGTTTYYLDFDGDDLGSDISNQYCIDYVPDGWVTNSNDEDDYCYTNNHDCIGECDGILEFDCLGECGGTAILDECSICNGNNSFCIDCFGEINGEAYLDGCGECVGGNTGNNACPFDCSGVPDGTATTDNCGICDNDSSNDCIQDCSGEWGGDLVIDECGICGGPGSISTCGCSDIPSGDCDCEGNTFDECGICGGNSSTCLDCNNSINGEAYLDGCGECVGGNTGNDACLFDCAGDPGGSEIVDICGICGGNGISDGDCNCAGNKFDECGICGGNGILDGDCNCAGNKFDECGICGGNGIPDGDCNCAGNKFDDCGDCVGVDVNYFNENQDIFGTCCSLSEKDICGECDGTGIEDGKCDCNGNILDCAGVCAGSVVKDQCGVCNGSNLPLTGTCDCNGTPNGLSVKDNCGTCDDDSSNDCTIDCLGDPNGDNSVDNCGTCDDDPSNDCVLDCSGIWGGTAILDENCEICVGGFTGADCKQDCAGIWGGEFWKSDCGCVEATNSGDVCDDCTGEPNGSAYEDECSNCIEIGDEENYECIEDCDGVMGGTHPPTFNCPQGILACNYGECNILLDTERNILPNQFYINKIYPNPSNPNATIEYQISQPTHIKLEIYNIRGQKIDELINEFILPGHYLVNWNGSLYPSGIYFIILYDNQSIIRKKIILLK